MATLSGSTIAGTYDQLVKRQDSYSQTGSNIEIMEDDGTIAVTGLYLEGGGGANVGIGVADADTKLEIFHAGTQLKLSYDATDFCTFAVDTNHDITITPSSTGQIKLKPTTDSVDFFQVLDADAGTPILNVDSTNERVGIRTAAPDEGLHVDTGTHLGYVTISSLGGNGTIAAHSIGSGTSTLWIGTSSIDVTAPSSRALKENIVDVPSTLSMIKGLRVRNFNYIQCEDNVEWIEDTHPDGAPVGWVNHNPNIIDGGDTHTGFVVEEVEELCPEAIIDYENGTKAVVHKTFIPHMVKAIQELSTENDNLKARVEALENE